MCTDVGGLSAGVAGQGAPGWPSWRSRARATRLLRVYGSFSVGALAVKNAEGNAIGAVRLTVFSDRLEIELLRIGAFTESFVPGALTERERFDAPYTSIRGLVRRGEALVLTLDPRCPTPHTRFALTHFTDLPLEALAQAHKRRTRAIFLRRLLPLPIAAAAALLVPADLASGALGRASVGLAAFAGAFGLLHLWVRVRSWGGPFSERLSQAFETRVAEHLAIVPGLDTAVHEPPAALLLPTPRRPPRKPPTTKPWRAPKPSAPSPQPAAAMATPRGGAAPLATTVAARMSGARRALRVGALAFASAAMGVAGFALYRWIDDSARMRVIEQQASSAPSSDGVSEGSSPTTEPAPEPAPPALPSCTCARADSPLWASAMPALSIVLISKQKGEDGKPLPTIAPFLTKRGASRYSFDVAVVNNTNVSLKDVRVVVTFARRNKQGERVGATDRGLYSANLRPGKSMKWSVSGPGTEYKIEITEKRTLGAAKGQLAPAPPDAFVTLLGAKQPPVRLHAALMLAYLHDARARDAADALGDLTESDDAVRQMVLRATEPLSLCDARVSEDALDACVTNGGGSATPPLEIFEVGPEGRAFPIGVGLAPGAGARIHVDGFAPRAAELGVREAPVRRGRSVDVE